MRLATVGQKTVRTVPAELADVSRWRKLRAIGMTLNMTIRNGKEHCEVRYYVLSRYLSSRRFAEVVRGHWSIENRSHWQLDVSFGEDQSRVRKGHGAANLSILRRTALSLLKNESTAKIGIKNKRRQAGWDHEYTSPNSCSGKDLARNRPELLTKPQKPA